jgi:hypothetical protein
MSVASQKRRYLNVNFSRGNRYKSAEAKSEEYGEWPHCSLLRNHLPQPTGVQEHCRLAEKSIVGSPFFGAFPSDSIPKGTKDVSVHLFIYL